MTAGARTGALWRSVTYWLGHNPIGWLVSIALITIGIVLVVHLLLALARRRISDREARYRTRKIIVGFGYFGFLIACFVYFEPRSSNLAVIVGFASAGLAFALQEVITSVAGYVAISFGGFFRVGDRVEFGGIKGDVIDVSILRTTLMEIGEWVQSDLYNGRVVRVTNSFIFKQPVYNYSGDYPFLWDELTVPITYATDYRLARQIIQRVADQVTDGFIAEASQTWESMQGRYSLSETSVAPIVTFTVNSNFIEFTLRYIVPYSQRRSIRDKLFTGIFDEFAEHPQEIQIGSTTMSVTLGGNVSTEAQPPGAIGS